MAEAITLPLGIRVNSDRTITTLGVIGIIEKSMSGNTVMHVGNIMAGADGWVKAAHVVLTPEEREAMIAKLIAQRES